MIHRLEVGFYALLVSTLFISCSNVNFAHQEKNAGGDIDNIVDSECVRSESIECGGTPGVDLELVRIQTTQEFDPILINAADILFVIDNSGSMKKEINELSSKFPNLFNALSGVDFRICVTTTDTIKSDGEFGQLISFDNGSKWIDSSTPNASTLFTDLLDDINEGDGDERGIYAINLALTHNEGCFRPGATLNTVVISDEDERSTGGYNQYKNHKQFYELRTYDFPESVFATLKSTFPGQAYTHHSIIIEPNDEDCLDDQSDQKFAAFYGTHYANLTSMTGGSSGSICASDYGAQLELIGSNIISTLSTVPLECEPVDANGDEITDALQVIANPAVLGGATASLSGNKITFDPPLSMSVSLELDYYCWQVK